MRSVSISYQHIAFAQIGPITASLANLKYLDELDLRDNNLTGYIDILHKLIFCLPSNATVLGEIPREFGALHHMEGLYLYGNHLSGTSL